MIFDQAFATSNGNISERAQFRNTRVAADPPDPLNPEWWKKKYPAAARPAYNKYYWKCYESKEPESPITTIDAQLAKVEKKGDQEQICVYRCMDNQTEAVDMGIDVVGCKAKRPSDLVMGKMTGHIGHLNQAREFCPQGGPQSKVLVEFLLKPGAHDLLTSPDVAALGIKSRKTALLAEVAKLRGLGAYVVKKGSSGEGYVKNYIGIKPEGIYYSLAMQANKKGEAKDNNTKRLFSALTQYVRAIKPGGEADCNKNPPVV